MSYTTISSSTQTQKSSNSTGTFPYLYVVNVQALQTRVCEYSILKLDAFLIWQNLSKNLSYSTATVYWTVAESNITLQHSCDWNAEKLF